jgi:hypothetical protein
MDGRNAWESITTHTAKVWYQFIFQSITSRLTGQSGYNRVKSGYNQLTMYYNYQTASKTWIRILSSSTQRETH